MRILLILAGLTLSLAASSQEIWRWVDKDGQLHYADQPGAANAERMILADPNAYESEPSPGDYAPSGSEPEERDAASPYTSLAIVQPTPDQAFFGAEATVIVAAELGGTLRPDHTVVFFVNGNRRPAGSGLGLELQNLERGSHFLRAAVLDQNGDPVITSQQITFHVRQASVNSPQSPQARPKPQPRPAPAG